MNDTLPQKYLIVDGYNMIGAWEDLRAMARYELAQARDSLADQLLNFCGMSGETLILVFDAHITKEPEKLIKIAKNRKDTIVYTRKGETADNYIERFVRINKGCLMRVASSDALVQVMIFAHAMRISARELQIEVDQADLALKRKLKFEQFTKNNLENKLNPSVFKALDKLRKK